MEADPEGVPVEDVSVRLDDRKGFQYKFGFDVKKRDYYYYDMNTRQEGTAKFVDEKVINGVTTYHFVSEVPDNHDSEHKPYHVDRCHALSSSSETVRRYYPRWYRDQAPG